jgi:hypothetical protein
MPIMECTLPEGGKGYQWGNSGHCYPDRADAEKQAAAAHANGYAGDVALDASARTIDADGRLHISKTHISKASVNPYYGREIPGAAALGLDPDKIYNLFREPGELKKAAPTFERNQILSKHVPVTTYDTMDEQEKKKLIVGVIGSDVEFNDPYLDADVAIWDSKAIAGIETETVMEFSCSYHYVPVMTPGDYKGEHYDGIMTQIVGNHLAVVESGRAGSDVAAADSNPFTRVDMTKMTKLGKALFVTLGAASSKLAQDSALPGLVGQAVKKTFDKAAVGAKLLAMDAELKKENVDAVMDAILDNDPEPKENPAKDADETEEEKKAREKKEAAAKDEEDDDEEDERKKKEAKDKKAKDKAAKDKAAKDSEEEVAKKIKPAMDSFKAELRDAAEAARIVRPVVGDVLAQDSAEDIYAFALDHLKVDHKGVTGVPALKALFSLASERTGTVAPKLAQDSAGLKAKFPNASRFSHA